jgi:hypothetical protein
LYGDKLMLSEMGLLYIKSYLYGNGIKLEIVFTIVGTCSSEIIRGTAMDY